MLAMFQSALALIKSQTTGRVSAMCNAVLPAYKPVYHAMSCRVMSNHVSSVHAMSCQFMGSSCLNHTTLTSSIALTLAPAVIKLRTTTSDSTALCKAL